MDLETLLSRLRTAAAEHAAYDHAEAVEVRAWPDPASNAARQVLIDGLAGGPVGEVGRFLGIDASDFVDLAFFATLGRAPDPTGREHYLGLVHGGTPRLEILSRLTGSDEGLACRGPVAWPLWLRPLLWGLQLPSAFGRRVARGVLRRVERRLGRSSARTAERALWKLTAAADERDHARVREMAALERALAAAGERAAAAEGRLDAGDERAERLSARIAGTESALAEGFEASSTALVALRARLAVMEYEGARAKDRAANGGLAGGGAHANSALAGGAAPIARDAKDATDATEDDVTRYYLTLESVFRGDPERIRAQLETDYLVLLVDARTRAGDGLCVDLGCGRGEWLEVLAAHGFAATGVDANPFMADAARERGAVSAGAVAQERRWEVVVGDALAYLRSLPDASVLAVTAFHLVEHLPFAVLFRLIAECRRVLKPDGILILETPNPENIWVATHTFHHDPTHGNPLTPASLEFLVNHHGLQTVEVLRLHPYPREARLPGTDPASERLNGMTCCGQDFAVVAKKVAAR